MSGKETAAVDTSREPRGTPPSPGARTPQALTLLHHPRPLSSVCNVAGAPLLTRENVLSKTDLTHGARVGQKRQVARLVIASEEGFSKQHISR